MPGSRGKRLLCVGSCHLNDTTLYDAGKLFKVLATSNVSYKISVEYK
jgi:hypothetical protein